MSLDQNTVDDRQLLARWRNGDMTAFDQLYQRYREPLYRFLLRRGHQQVDAEEVFHDSWLRVMDHLDHFDDANFKAWLYRIARNLSTDLMRRKQPSALEESTQQEQLLTFSTERTQEGVDCMELIRKSVAALPVEQRDVFLLQHEAGLALQQIADLMAVGRETIKSRIRYAMQQLRKMMADCL